MMLSKYWPNSSDPSSSEGGAQDSKVSKATSPLCFDDERAASRELEQIFATQKEVDRIKAELERERARRISLEARCAQLKDRSPSEEEEEEETESSDTEEYKQKRPRMIDPSTNNLDIIVRAIRQIEGDAFSRSATPTCGSQERSAGTFTPISTGDNSRLSPVTPVCAS